MPSVTRRSEKCLAAIIRAGAVKQCPSILPSKACSVAGRLDQDSLLFVSIYRSIFLDGVERGVELWTLAFRVMLRIAKREFGPLPALVP